MKTLSREIDMPNRKNEMSMAVTELEYTPLCV